MYHHEHCAHASPMTGSVRTIGTLIALACVMALAACSGKSVPGEAAHGEATPGEATRPAAGEQPTASSAPPGSTPSISSAHIYLNLDDSNTLQYRTSQNGSYTAWPSGGTLKDLLPPKPDRVVLQIEGDGLVGCDEDGVGALTQWRLGTRRHYSFPLHRQQEKTKQFTVCKTACAADAGSSACADPVLIIDRKGNEDG